MNRVDGKQGEHLLVLYVSEVNKSVMNALRHAKLLSGRRVGVHVMNSSDAKGIADQWKRHVPDVPLFILDSPNDSLLDPLAEFVDEIRHRHEGGTVTLLLPVISGLKWWQRFLHNQTERLIEKAFQSKAGVVTVRVPFSIAADSHRELQHQGKGI